MCNSIRGILLICTAACLAACTSDRGAEVPGADAVAQDTKAEAPAPVERFVHEVDLMSVIKRFLSPEGFMDPEFPPTVAKPSPYLTDFFGVQTIGDVTRDEIISDFVPGFAEIDSDGENAITLKFQDGFTATFYPVSTFVAMGNSVDVSHVVLSGETWQEARRNVNLLLQMIAKMDREDAYLIENPFYELEKKTYEVMSSGMRADVKIDPKLSQFYDSDNGILLFPEAVHGVSKDADELIKIIEAGGIDWVGFESLNTSQQPELDELNAAVEGTAEYDAARDKLVDYYAEAWNGRAGPKTTGEENYYFKLAEAAHKAGARVIALEGSSLEYLFFRYGETAFGGAVRSLIWANATPESGRGILFGGGAHFNYPDVPMVQDLIHADDPGRPFFSVRDLWAKKNQ
jgi:hypothetical protein